MCVAARCMVSGYIQRGEIPCHPVGCHTKTTHPECRDACNASAPCELSCPCGPRGPRRGPARCAGPLMFWRVSCYLASCGRITCVPTFWVRSLRKGWGVSIPLCVVVLLIIVFVLHTSICHSPIVRLSASKLMPTLTTGRPLSANFDA